MHRASALPASPQVTHPYELGGIFSPVAQVMKLRHQAAHGETAQEHRTCVDPTPDHPTTLARQARRLSGPAQFWHPGRSGVVCFFYFNRGIWGIGTGSERGCSRADSGCKTQRTTASAGRAFSGFQILHEGSTLASS